MPQPVLANLIEGQPARIATPQNRKCFNTQAFSNRALQFISPYGSQVRSAVSQGAIAARYPIPVKGDLLDAVVARTCWITRIVGNAFGLPEPIIQRVLDETEVRLFISDAQSWAGNGGMDIYWSRNVDSYERASSLLLIIASEVGHRFHQVLIENNKEDLSLVSLAVAEAFDAMAQIIVAHAIDEGMGVREISRHAQSAEAGFLLLQAFDEMRILPEEFQGGVSQESEQVLDEVLKILHFIDYPEEAAWVHELLVHMARDFFMVAPEGLRVLPLPGSHLTGAWIITYLMERVDPINRAAWPDVARTLGQTLQATHASRFSKVSSFLSLLHELTQDKGTFRSEAFAVHKEIHEIVHGARTSPLMFHIEDQAVYLNSFVAEPAVFTLVYQAMKRRFPNHTIAPDDIHTRLELKTAAELDVFLKNKQHVRSAA